MSHKILAIIAVVLILLGLVVWWNSRPKRLNVTFFNVGRGEASLIQTPRGQTILIDGGADRTILKKLGERLPWTARYIDLLVLTYPQADHLTGLLEVVNRYKVGRVLMTGVKYNSLEYEIFLQRLVDKKIAVTYAQAGQVVNLQGGAKFTVLWPGSSYKDNIVTEIKFSTLVTKFTWDENSIVFMSDVDADMQTALLAAKVDPRGQIVKVGPHSGRKINKNFWQSAEADFAVAATRGQAEALKFYVGQVFFTSGNNDARFEGDGKEWYKVGKQ